MSQLPIVLAITGASGAPYALRVLQGLVAARRRTWVIISSHGMRLLSTELGIGTVEELREAVGAEGWETWVTPFSDTDRGAAPASGSTRTAGMIICPCSMGTVAAVAHGTSRSLVERAADVALKERRRLVVVPRETPYSEIHLDNMLRLTRAGGIVLPASPGFYHRPTEVAHLVDFVAARVLDLFDVEHSFVRRWGGEPDALNAE